MNIVLIACVILVLQSYFSLMQIFYYKKHISKITQQYANSNNYYLFSSVQRLHFNTRAIVIIVVNDNNTIKECQILQGKTIFARFKALPQFYEQNLSHILTQLKNESVIRKLSLPEQTIVKTLESKLLS
ncbi:transcriptional regulator GutM [Gilliamella sp. ESL0254]|uniref:transcriptional regulator GutM n=1 Tax=Gilliamella sp. ESL0254 TaxID=2705035 RepID=UPI001580AE1D|nr:transcriptional regulator GutM [Gilliamella sp. ESL0254]NUF26928.1 transcriptional regulator [Gilliamella sp. ESL0254]